MNQKMSLDAGSSENFSKSTKCIKNRIPICKAAKNKRLLRLLQQRAVANKSANFLGTKIYVYHRIAKRKKFNKLAVCLMNRELYNSIRDLGCHTWVMGIQYGMIRELRRIHGQRILNSRCLENLEDIPTEMLLYMIWKQLQLIPVTQKVAEDKLQQIVRCYMSLIWAVSIRKGLQTIHNIRKKTQKDETNLNMGRHSGSVNWKWRILQQSNKLLSKFLLKTGTNKVMKRARSQKCLQNTDTCRNFKLSQADNKDTLQKEPKRININKRRSNTIESKIMHSFDKVISEMKIVHAAKQLCSENNQDCFNLESSKSQIDTLKEQENLTKGKSSHFPGQNLERKIQERTKMSVSIKKDQRMYELFQSIGENSKHNPNLEVNVQQREKNSHLGSYFQVKDYTNRDKNDLSHFTLTENYRQHVEEQCSSFLLQTDQANSSLTADMYDTSEKCSEKLSEYMRELNSSDEMISQEAREYCKQLLLSKFEADLPRIMAMNKTRRQTLLTRRRSKIDQVGSCMDYFQCQTENLLNEISSHNQESELVENLQLLCSPSFRDPALSGKNSEKNTCLIRDPQNLEKRVETSPFCLSNREHTMETRETLNSKNKREDNIPLSHGIFNSIKLKIQPEKPKWFQLEDEIIHQNFREKRHVIRESEDEKENSKCQEMDDADYEVTLRNLQKSISLHDTELRKLRVLNNFIGTNWQYISSGHKDEPKIKINPSVARLEFCQDCICTLQTNEKGTAVWRELCTEKPSDKDDHPLKIPSKSFEPLVAGDDDKILAHGQTLESNDNFCMTDDKSKNFADFFRKVYSQDQSKSGCSLEIKLGVEKGDKGKKSTNKLMNGLQDELEKTAKECMANMNNKVKNMFIQRTYSNKFIDNKSARLSKNFNRLRQRTSKKFNNLKKTQRPTSNVREKGQPHKVQEFYQSLRRKLAGLSMKFKRESRLHRNEGMPPKIQNDTMKLLETYLKESSGEIFCHKPRTQLRHNRAAGDLHETVKEKTQKEKTTELIYNNNNFDLKSQTNFFHQRRHDCQENQATELKNMINTNAKGKLITKALLKEKYSDDEQNQGVIQNQRMFQKPLEIGLGSIEKTAPGVKQFEKFLMQKNVPLEAKSIETNNFVLQDMKLDQREWLDVCHLMFERKKQLGENLKMLNDFLHQLLQSKPKRTQSDQKMKESLIRKNFQNVKPHAKNKNRGQDLYRPNLTRSEIVNATYYVKNQTVIKHSKNKEKTPQDRNMYKKTDLEPLPFRRKGYSLPRAPIIYPNGISMAQHRSRITSPKKFDLYWLIIFMAGGFLLYHAVNLFALFLSNTQPIVKLSCRAF